MGCCCPRVMAPKPYDEMAEIKVVFDQPASSQQIIRTVDPFNVKDVCSLRNQQLVDFENQDGFLRVSHCQGSKIKLGLCFQSVLVEHCEDSVVALGPIKQNAKINYCKGCVFLIFTQELSVKRCSQCVFYLHCESQLDSVDCQSCSFRNVSFFVDQRFMESFGKAGLDYFGTWKCFRSETTDDKGVDFLRGSTESPNCLLPLSLNRYYSPSEAEQEVNLYTEFEVTYQVYCSLVEQLRGGLLISYGLREPSELVDVQTEAEEVLVVRARVRAGRQFSQWKVTALKA